VGDNDLVTGEGAKSTPLGQARELEEGAIPPDLLLEILDCGGL
jgi:hypothetical protein